MPDTRSDGAAIDAMTDALPDAMTDALPDAMPDAPTGPTVFEVTVPANTPPDDVIYLQSAHQAKAMTRTGPRTWSISLVAADLANLDFDGTTLGYAYTRDAMAYYGGEAVAGDPMQAPWAYSRHATIVPATVADTVTRWRYSPVDGEILPTMSATTATFVPRTTGWTFQAGVQIADYWPGLDDGPAGYVDPTSAAIARTHAKWVQLAPPWNYQSILPHPVLSSDRALIPAYPDADLRAHVQNLKAHGFKVMFRIQVCCDTPTAQQLTGVPTTWYDEWFAQYDAFIQYHALLAQQEGVDAILLDWSGNLLLPGVATAPADAVARWTALIAHARQTYTGKLGYDLLTLGSGDPSQPPWPFTNVAPIASLFDFFGIAMWGPLATTTTPTQAGLDQAVAALFAGTFAAVTNATGKPVIISGLAYGSFDGAAMAAIPYSDPGFSAAFGPESGASLPYDGIEQAMILQAVLTNVATTPTVVGVYPFHYNWVALPKDVGWSMRGKASESVLGEWYTTLP
jgi:hypothetical protein